MDDDLKYRNDPKQFLSIYKRSYQDVPTYYVSPLYDKDREMRDPNPKHYPRDLSPYPNRTYDETNYDYLDKRSPQRREWEQRELEKWKRQQQERDEQRNVSPYRGVPRQQQDIYDQRNESPYRGQQREDSSQRNSYGDPGTNRSRYDQEVQRRSEMYEPPMSYRQNQQIQQEEQNGRSRHHFREENLHPPIGNTVEPEEEFIRDSDNPPRFCNRCFRSKVCINKLKCPHQYCDSCLKQLRGSENPFRGSWLWHYKCGLCKTDEWCSEQRIQRYDAMGRRIVRYTDVNYQDARR